MIEDNSPVIPPAGSPDDLAGGTRSAPRPGRHSLSIMFAEPQRREKEFTLDHPLIVEGERLSSFTLRRLTGEQLYALVMEGGTEFILERARAAIAGLSVEVIAAFDADDMTRFVEETHPFLPRDFQKFSQHAPSEENARTDAKVA